MGAGTYKRFCRLGKPAIAASIRCTQIRREAPKQEATQSVNRKDDLGRYRIDIDSRIDTLHP